MWRPKFTHEVILILALFYNAEASVISDVMVYTNVGTIKGLRASDGDYSMFMGIPYAKVDEANPFGVSTPYPKFDEVFEAYNDSAICPQIEQFNNTYAGTLDCLCLNIYVPKSASPTNRLPILVSIYGGGFGKGSYGRYQYGPRYLVRHDVILVTLNYRLGPYGFMCLDIPEVPGNQGFKDQLLALRWIRDNIGAFGGDVKRTTIFGESAGSISIDFFLRFTHENLFNNIILQSGTTLTPVYLTESDRTVPLMIAERLGFVTDNFKEALSFLTTVDTKSVIEATSEFTYQFRGCVEKDFKRVEKFIWDYPFNEKIVNNKIAIIIGLCNKETLTFYGGQDTEFFKNTTIIYNDLKDSFDFEDEYLDEMYEVVREFYFGDVDINEQIMWRYIDYTTDFTFASPVTRTIEKYIEDGIKSIFQYVFTYDGNRNIGKQSTNVTLKGAAHGDELGYLFELSYLGEKTPEDQLTIDRMTTMWTNFAKYSDPTPAKSNILPVKWRPVENDLFYYLDIGSELSLRSKPFKERMAFWKQFFKVNGKLQKGYKGH